MSRLSRGLATLATRAGLGRPARAVDDGPVGGNWRAPLDDSLLRRLDRVALQQRRPAAGGLGGEHRSRTRAASTDFLDHRAYTPGDDFRQIDWNAYGRLNQLYVRLTEGRERLSLNLLLDCSASMGLGQPRKFDLARQLVAVLGYVALARHDRLHLIPLSSPSLPIRTLRGRPHFGELLALLDQLQPAGQLRFEMLADDARLRQATGQAILISDLLDEDGVPGALDALLGLGLAPAVVQVVSPQELTPDHDGDLELVDVESGEIVQVGLSRTTAAVYQRRLATWLDDLAGSCSARQIPYRLVRSDEALERLALAELRRVGVLR